MTMQDTHVSLAHGNGGRYMRELIHEIFARHLANPLLDTESDAAVLPWNAADGELAFTTDSFTVQPIEFPGRQHRLARRCTARPTISPWQARCRST